MLRIGLLGFGYAAQTFHLPLILACEGAELTHVASSDLNKVQQRLPHITQVHSPLALCQHNEVDLVVITSPNDTHFDLAKAAIVAGKHVLVDKPLTLTHHEAVELNTLAAQHGVTLCAFHNRRFDGDFLTLKKLLANGTLGEVVSFTSHFDRYRPEVRARWRELAGKGTGIWYDLGPHLLDHALALFGRPTGISASLKTLRPSAEKAQTTDFAEVTLHYPNQHVRLNASMLSAAPNKRFQCDGTKGTLVINGLDEQETQLKENLPLSSPEFGVSKQSALLYNAEGVNSITIEKGRYGDFYPLLVASIAQGTALPHPIEDAMTVMYLLEMATTAAELEKTIPLTYS